MKRMWKRLLSLALGLVLCLGLLSAVPLTTASAADGTTTVELTVTYDQTGARSMLSMINEFRTSSDAWYWNDDDTTKTTCSNLSELTYDYTLEAVAMQRAAEIALYYNSNHNRPDGTEWYTAYSEAGYTIYYAGKISQLARQLRFRHLKPGRSQASTTQARGIAETC